MQPLTGETLRFATANNEDGAHVDVSASRSGEINIRRHFFDVSFDVKMINAINAPSYRGILISSLYQCFEREKQQKYEQRIREIEMGSFTPLVFSTLRGGMGHCCCCILQKTCFPCLSLEGVII